MRAFLVFLLLVAVTQVYSQSCCCTGAGSNYNILPNLNKHVLGLRYAYKEAYSIYPKSLNPELTGLRKDEYMHIAEIFGRFNLKERLQLSVFVPVAYLQQNSRTTTNRQYGLSDMSLMLQYGVLNPLNCNGKNEKHQLRFGAGVKLPSGQFNKEPNGMFATNLQLGTGSLDFLFNAIYTYRINNFGFNLSAAYKLNTYNNQQFKFGDKLQSMFNCFYVFKVNELSVMPTAGVSYDFILASYNNKRMLDYTGGHFLNAALGLDIYYKQFAFSSTVTPALMNKLNWSGELRNKLYFEAGVFYNFSTIKSINKNN